MGKQGVAAIEDMGDRIYLVGAKLDLRVHTYEGQMGAVILPGTDGVELLIVELA